MIFYFKNDGHNGADDNSFNIVFQTRQAICSRSFALVSTISSEPFYLVINFA